MSSTTKRQTIRRWTIEGQFGSEQYRLHERRAEDHKLPMDLKGPAKDGYPVTKRSPLFGSETFFWLNWLNKRCARHQHWRKNCIK
jgi:hypothetical protein